MWNVSTFIPPFCSDWLNFKFNNFLVNTSKWICRLSCYLLWNPNINNCRKIQTTKIDLWRKCCCDWNTVLDQSKQCQAVPSSSNHKIYNPLRVIFYHYPRGLTHMSNALRNALLAQFISIDTSLKEL